MRVDNYRGVFDHRLGFGRRPALLVVDFVRAYTTPGAALYAPAVVDAVHATVPLLDEARRAAVPIAFTRVVYANDGRDGGVFVRKVPVLRTLVEGEPLAELVPELTPRPEETVFSKQYPSAFFGTPLGPWLVSQSVDTLLLVGCSTSGCVRATAVDGLQHGYRVMVVRECVGDRDPRPHEASLFDIDSKYGDVVSRDETTAFLRRMAV